MTITGSIVTPTSVIFVSASDLYTVTVYKLDENNNWEIVEEITDSATEQNVSLSTDGVYYFKLKEDGGEDENHFVYVMYEDVKSKLRAYIKTILCNCCENNCDPCSNETVYDFNMLHHLSLTYLGNNEYLLIQTDMDDTSTLNELYNINNGIVRTKKYILKYDL